MGPSRGVGVVRGLAGSVDTQVTAWVLVASGGS